MTALAPKIILSPFCSRDSECCTVPLSEKLPLVIANFKNARRGYRDGVLLVTIPADDFIGRIVQLREGDALVGSYKARQPGETPRKEVRAASAIASDVVEVDVVLYHRDVLAEGNENSDLSADYEIITWLPKIATGDQPMPPETLMANHFLDSGGTATNMDDAEFAAKLRESYYFWRDKALIS